MLCADLGVNFLNRMLPVAGITGTAAANINQETIHQACCLNFDRSNTTQDDALGNEIYLLIVDEISFASIKQLETLNE